MGIGDYLDSTYLKTPKQSGLSDSETLEKVHQLTREADENGIYAVMIRPDYVGSVRMLLDEMDSQVKLGTVIDFPEGEASAAVKMKEAQKALQDGADELDFVADYRAYIDGNTEKLKEEIEICSKLVLNEKKVVKWIIETAALTDEQIVGLTGLIREVVLERLSAYDPKDVFVKTSTGFYQTQDGKPSGATPHSVGLILLNAAPLSVKAAGGVRTAKDARKMIKMGVRRIGTSSAAKIVSEDAN